MREPSPMFASGDFRITEGTDSFIHAWKSKETFDERRHSGLDFVDEPIPADLDLDAVCYHPVLGLRVSDSAVHSSGR